MGLVIQWFNHVHTANAFILCWVFVELNGHKALFRLGIVWTESQYCREKGIFLVDAYDLSVVCFLANTVRKMYQYKLYSSYYCYTVLIIIGKILSW